MKKNILGIASIFVLLIMACNLPGTITITPNSDSANNDSPAVGSSDTPAAAIVFTDTVAPVIVSTDTASPTPTPQDPLVLRATLCYEGPGPAYPVVSALKQNERVKLLGRGGTSGWFVIDNPIYHDPCWVAEGDLQIEAGTDLASLRIITAPPTSTPTPKPPTATPTFTKVP